MLPTAATGAEEIDEASRRLNFTSSSILGRRRIHPRGRTKWKSERESLMVVAGMEEVVAGMEELVATAAAQASLSRTWPQPVVTNRRPRLAHP